MRIFSYIIWFLLIIVGIVFATLNSHYFPLNYFFGARSVYFPLLFLLLIGLGVLLGWFAFLPTLLKHRSLARRLRQRVKTLEQEVSNLRQIPIKDNH